MPYPSVTSINASLGFGEILNYVNTVTDEWISKMLLMAVYVIVLMGYYKAQNDFKGALAVAGYGTFVIGLLFWAGGFVSGVVLGACIGVAILGTLFLLLDNSGSN